jgi:hypothetical protein
MQKKFFLLCIPLALTACGAGDGIDAIPKPNLNVDSLLANWKTIDQRCIELGPQSSYKEISNNLWWQDFKKIYNAYNNASCTDPAVGIITDTYQAEWSSPTSIRTKSGAARVELRAPVRVTEGLTPQPTLTLETTPILALFAAENNQLQMYTGGSATDLDGEGYPLGLLAPTAVFSK